MFRKILVILLLPVSLHAAAQCNFSVPQGNVLTGTYVAEHIPTANVVPYPYVGEADVMWSKRIWRVIDLREKINMPIYYPLEPTNEYASLWDIIKCNVEEGNLTAYNPGPLLDDDEFKVPYSAAELQDILHQFDTVWTVSIEDGETMIPTLQQDDLESAEIKQYILKEDWFFDRERSIMDVRIIGIAPVREVKGDDGEMRGYAPVFWLYFPECRYIFANVNVFNRQNDVKHLSYDDLFMKRMFSSYIKKESNVYDRNINESYTGIDALLESERIKDVVFRMEHDMWHF